MEALIDKLWLEPLGGNNGLLRPSFNHTKVQVYGPCMYTGQVLSIVKSAVLLFHEDKNNYSQLYRFSGVPNKTVTLLWFALTDLPGAI